MAVMTSPAANPASAAGLLALDGADDHARPRFGRIVRRGHADPRLVDVAGGQQPGGDDRGDLVDGDGKTDALGAGADRHVDADHVAVDVQQRPARIARVDAGVGLDQIVVELGVAHLDRPVQGADDAAGDRVLVAVGVAHRNHRLARHQVGERADGNHRQRALRVDLDDGQVGFRVAGDQLGDVPLAVGQ